MHKSVLLGLVLFVGLAAAIDIDVDKDTIKTEELARSKRWFGWGGYGLGYGLGFGWPYYGFYGKRNVEPVKEVYKRDVEIAKPHAEKLIDLHIGKREFEEVDAPTRDKRWFGYGLGYGLGYGYGLGFGWPYYGFYGKRDLETIDEKIPVVDTTLEHHKSKRSVVEKPEEESSRSKRWFGWGGYGLGYGLGWGGYYGGWGWPYYGFYGKRDVSTQDKPIEREVIEQAEHSVNKRAAEPIVDTATTHDSLDETERAKRWFVAGGRPVYGRPYGRPWGKRDVDIKVKRQWGHNFNNNNAGGGMGSNFNNNNAGGGYGHNFNNNNGGWGKRDVDIKVKRQWGHNFNNNNAGGGWGSNFNNNNAGGGWGSNFNNNNGK